MPRHGGTPERVPLLFVGQAPGRPWDQPRRGRSWDRLAALIGLTPQALIQHLRWVNLLDTYPGHQGKGDAFPRTLARQQARIFPLAPITVVGGKHVGRAFGLTTDYFTWQDVRGCQVVIVPHPSGVNQWWNLPAHRQQFRDFMRMLLHLP